MEADTEALINLPVVHMNIRHLYAIIAVLGAAILGCTCVIAYSVSNYSELKRNADVVHKYIDFQAKAADLQSDRDAWKGSAGARSSTGVGLVQAALVTRYKPRLYIGAPSNTDTAETAGGTVASVTRHSTSNAQS